MPIQETEGRAFEAVRSQAGPGNESGRARQGFTLVELMVTIAIITVLFIAGVFAVSGAQESASISKTRTLIARLHSLIMARYESYRYRRLPIQIPPGLAPTVAAQVRCDALRQLMRLEMPDRWSDILDPPAPIQVSGPSGAGPIQMAIPAATQAYLAFYNSPSVQGSPAMTSNNGNKFMSAKCLYLIVTMGLEESDALENFADNDAADVDQSGCKVFVDAWGNPIEFLRWAPGFTSPLQTWPPVDPDQTDPTGVRGRLPTNPGTDPSQCPATNPDGSNVSFALYPLIYSAGPDGFYDLNTDNGTNAWHCASSTPPNNPFGSMTFTVQQGGYFGFPYVDPTTGRAAPANVDNITNHSIGQR